MEVGSSSPICSAVTMGVPSFAGERLRTTAKAVHETHLQRTCVMRGTSCAGSTQTGDAMAPSGSLQQHVRTSCKAKRANVPAVFAASSIINSCSV